MRSGDIKEQLKPSYGQSRTISKLGKDSSRSKNNISPEKNSLVRIKNPSNFAISRSPYAKDEIQRVSKCVTEERRIRMNEEIISNSRNMVKPDKHYNPKRKMKNSVLTLPPSTLPPASGCRHCHEALELCERCAKSKIKACSTKRVRTAIGDKLQTDSDREQHSGVEDEIKELTNIMHPHNITPNLSFISSKTFTPDKELDCRDMWNFMQELNQQKYAKETNEKSEESILDKLNLRRPRKRNDARVLESTRTEEITYSYECITNSKIESSGMSNESSCENDGDVYRPFQVVCSRKNRKSVGTSASKNDQRYNSSQNTRSDGSGYTNATGTCGDLTNTYDGSSCRMPRNPSPKKDFRKYNTAAAIAKNLFQKTPNKGTEVKNKAVRKEEKNSTKYANNSSSKNSSPVRTKKKTNNKKISFPDIKRKLAQIKYPLTIIGREACASVILPEYDAPQFAYMPKIWQYMSGWSTNYRQDNCKPNKYLKLLQKQDKVTNRTYRGVCGRQPKQYPRSPVRGYNVKNSYNNSPSNTGLSDKTLKVLFRNACEVESKTGQVCKKPLTTQPSKTQTIYQTQPRRYGPSAHKVETVISKINNVSETQSIDWNDKIDLRESEEIFSMIREALAKTQESVREREKHAKQAVRSCKLSKSKEDWQTKLQSTLNKIDNKSYYDYNRWIENSSTKTRKYPAGRSKKKNCFLSQPKPDSVKDIISDAISLLENNTNEKDSPKITQTQSKPRKRTLRKQRDFKSKHQNALTDNTHGLIQYKNDDNLEQHRKTSGAVPLRDIMENNCKILIKNLSGDQIIIEDFLRNFVVGFDITNSYIEPDTEKVLIYTSDDKILLHEIDEGTNQYYKSSYKLSTLTLPQQICSILPGLFNRLQTGKYVIIAQKDNNATNIIEPPIQSEKKEPFTIKRMNVVDGHLPIDLKYILREKEKNYNYPIFKSLEFCKEGKLLLKTPKIHGFIENFTNIVHKFKLKDARKKFKFQRPTTEKKISKLLIKFPLWLNNSCESNLLQNTLFNELPALKYNDVDYRKAVIPVTSSQVIPTVTFPIPIKVIKIFLELISNGNLCKCLIVRDDSNANTFLEEEKDYVCIKEKPRKRHIVRMGTSITKLDNNFSDKPLQTKTQVPRKAVSLAEFINSNAIKLKTYSKRCSRVSSKIFHINDITDVERFMTVIGGSRSFILSEVISKYLAGRILAYLKEFSTWTEELTPRQALLILLLSSKPETPSLFKFRLALLHGIATGHISNSTDLEKECLAVEEDAEVTQSETPDLILMKELYSIAKKAASEQNKPFSVQTQKAIDSLINRKKKLNPSYMKVMARYAGIGLYTSPDVNSVCLHS